MDHEMIERVARTIHDHTNISIRIAMLIAPKIIKAMREPTENMIRRGYAVRPTEECWRKMIDAITGSA